MEYNMLYRKVYRKTYTKDKVSVVQDLINMRRNLIGTPEEMYQDVIIMSTANKHKIEISNESPIILDRSDIGQKLLLRHLKACRPGETGLVMADVTGIYPHSYIEKAGTNTELDIFKEDFEAYYLNKTLVFASGPTEINVKGLIIDESFSSLVELYPFEKVSKEYKKINNTANEMQKAISANAKKVKRLPSLVDTHYEIKDYIKSEVTEDNNNVIFEEDLIKNFVGLASWEEYACDEGFYKRMQKTFRSFLKHTEKHGKVSYEGIKLNSK
jgi:hypothetical protein